MQERTESEMKDKSSKKGQVHSIKESRLDCPTFGDVVKRHWSTIKMANLGLLF